jgi:hypothetical protein
MVKIVEYSQLEQLADTTESSKVDKCLIVQPDERKILVNYKEQFAQAEEMAKKLECPCHEYTVVKCYEE